MATELVPVVKPALLPAVLAGHETPQVAERIERFYVSIAEIFERWVTRRKSAHTQRAYREDVMSFVKFMGFEWPRDAIELLAVSLKDVQAFRDEMISKDAAPKTLNRRISSLSSFYKYLGAAAAELRLPITVSNPAHAQFIARESTDARDETKALTATRAPVDGAAGGRWGSSLPGPGNFEALSLFRCPALHGMRPKGLGFSPGA